MVQWPWGRVSGFLFYPSHKLTRHSDCWMSIDSKSESSSRTLYATLKITGMVIQCPCGQPLGGQLSTTAFCGMDSIFQVQGPSSASLSQSGEYSFSLTLFPAFLLTSPLKALQPNTLNWTPTQVNFPQSTCIPLTQS